MHYDCARKFSFFQKMPVTAVAHVAVPGSIDQSDGDVKKLVDFGEVCSLSAAVGVARRWSLYVICDSLYASGDAAGGLDTHQQYVQRAPPLAEESSCHNLRRQTCQRIRLKSVFLPPPLPHSRQRH